MAKHISLNIDDFVIVAGTAGLFHTEGQTFKHSKKKKKKMYIYNYIII